MGCGIIFPRNYNSDGSKRISKSCKKSNISSDESDRISLNSSSDERLERVSQSSHSGAENDSSVESDENEYYEDEWHKGWVFPVNNDVVPLKSRFLGFRQKMLAMPPMAAIPVGPPNGHNGIDRYEERNESHNWGRVEVFFTRNGVIIGQKEIPIPKGGFYPTVGMLSTAEKVRVDLHPLTG